MRELSALVALPNRASDEAGIRRNATRLLEMLERRYEFYVEQVQPAVELLKASLGSDSVALIDAHQPAYDDAGVLDLDRSVRNVAGAALASLGVSRHILRNLAEED